MIEGSVLSLVFALEFAIASLERPEQSRQVEVVLVSLSLSHEETAPAIVGRLLAQVAIKRAMRRILVAVKAMLLVVRGAKSVKNERM